MTEQRARVEIPLNLRPDEFQILIVDDNKANLKLLGEILQMDGYKIRPASSGHLALLSIQAQKPDLIMLDIRMPEIDGYSICTQLKADEGTRDIPVIFISALEDVADKVRGFEVGAVDYITKPFEQAEVLMRVRTHLALSNLRKSLEIQNIKLEEEIDEREQAEEELRVYQTHLESIITDRTANLHQLIEELSFHNVLLITQQETSLDGILVFNDQGRVLSYNQRFLDIWQIPPEQTHVISSDWIRTHFTENISYHGDLDYFLSLLVSHSYEKSRSEFTLNDGRIVDHYSSPIINPEGRYFGRVFYFRDITEQRQAEKDIQEKTEELDRFFSLNLDLLAILDIEGRFRRINPEWEKTLGYSLNELLSLNILSFVHPEDMEATEQALEDLLEKKVTFNFINRVRTRNNSYRWIEWRSVVFGDLIYSAARDITSRKEADEQIQAGVQMLTRTQETFAALNDQIRNPLSIISIYSEECDECRGDRIRNEVMRIDEIINQLDKGWIESDKVRRVMQRYLY